MQEESFKALQRRTRVGFEGGSAHAACSLQLRRELKKLLCVPLSEGAGDDYWRRGSRPRVASEMLSSREETRESKVTVTK